MIWPWTALRNQNVNEKVTMKKSCEIMALDEITKILDLLSGGMSAGAVGLTLLIFYFKV
jgi:hypothetical protein